MGMCDGPVEIEYEGLGRGKVELKTVESGGIHIILIKKSIYSVMFFLRKLYVWNRSFIHIKELRLNILYNI